MTRISLTFQRSREPKKSEPSKRSKATKDLDEEEDDSEEDDFLNHSALELADPVAEINRLKKIIEEKDKELTKQKALIAKLTKSKGNIK